MSNLRLGNDDHPEAAGKHLNDSIILRDSQRWDGAGYLAGYVVECCLKTLLLIENNMTPTWSQHNKGHDLDWLRTAAEHAASSATAKTAKYKSAVVHTYDICSKTNGWSEKIRYCSSGRVLPPMANQWVKEAETLYKETIALMVLDGKIT